MSERRFSGRLNGLVRDKQRLGYIAIGVFFVVSVSYVLLRDDGETRPIIPRSDGAEIMSLDRQLDAESAWRSSAEAQLTTIDKRMRELEADNKKLREQLQITERDAKDVIDAQAEVIRQMDGASPARQGAPPSVGGSRDVIVPTAPIKDFTNPAQGQSNAGGVAPLMPARGDGVPSGNAGGAPSVAQPRMVTFDLTAPIASQTHDTKYYVPTGAFAPGVVIAGVSASVGLEAQEEPQPGLIRLLGPAKSVLDPDGEPLETDLTGCLVTVVAKGDLSSERVYLRPQKMTCPERLEGGFSEGIIERAVKGFVAGTGKAGIRGPVVIRESDLIEKALWAGLISGLGNGISNSFRNTAPVVLDGNSTTIAPDLQDLQNGLNAGLAGGVGNAANTLAQYYISRLEQIQPVIELAAGTRIELVFLEGVSLKQPQQLGGLK